jgi:hypothetical protein
MSAGFTTEVLIKMSMLNNVSAVINLIGKDILKLKNDILSTKGALESLKTPLGRAMLGAGLVAGGSVLIKGALALTNAADELNHQQTLWLAAGINNADMMKGTKDSWRQANTIMGSDVATNMASMLHLRQILANPDELYAKDAKTGRTVGDEYVRNSIALHSITGEDGEGQMHLVARTIDALSLANGADGKFSAGLFAQNANLMTAQIAAGGGKLKAEDLLTLAQRGGSYMGNIANAKDANGVSQGLVNLTGMVQTLGGSTTGTTLTMMNRALKDGSLYKSTFEGLQTGLAKAGGLYDMKKVHVGSGNSPIRFDPGALQDEAKFKGNPMAWVWEDLIPKMKKAGYATADEQVNFLQHAKLNASTTKFLSEAVRNEALFKREAENVRQAQKVNQYDQVMSHDVDANVEAMKKAWHNLAAAIGISSSGQFIAGLQAITSGIQAVTGWFSDHPTAGKIIVDTLMTVGIAMVAIGAALLISSTPFIWVPLLIGGVIAAIAWLSTLDWSVIAKAVGKFFVDMGTLAGHAVMQAARWVGHMVMGFVRWYLGVDIAIIKFVADIVVLIAKWIAGIWTAVVTGFQDFFTRLGVWLLGLVKLIPGVGKFLGGAGAAAAPPAAKVGGRDTHATIHVPVHIGNNKLTDHIQKVVLGSNPNVQTGPSFHNPAHTFSPPGANPTSR